ncbi:LIC12162 family protein [Daejeonella sp. H1SJ63]|uniref:LIC12162 family transferase n=1 Tax=Daejeonella sp. H1SJ63 TaxID=3034145 RepID=UPI0023ED438E|nr:LIC12162 family protein [Daejeonella sp. H1SJ63]
MVKRFLITTALEETWRDNEPVLFLGEWCKLYSRKEQWSQMEAQVLPYHWDDRAKLESDYQYLQDFYEVLLADLSIKLNQIHGVSHDLRYWRILVGPWLAYFVQMLFDRWYSIEQAVRQFDINETVVLIMNEEHLVPNDFVDFIRLFTGDEWNHFLYSEILLYFPSISTISCPYQAFKGIAQPISRKSRVKRFLSGCYTKIISFTSRDEDVFLLSTYLPEKDESNLYRRLGQKPQRWRSVSPVKSSLNNRMRQWNLDGESKSQFEVCARSLISRQIPKVYLEGYSELIKYSTALPWPKRPKLIWTSNCCNSDDVFKAWAAEKVERRSPLVIGQHGGNYGIGKRLFIEDHEIKISDHYLTWGWSKSNESKIIPIGQLISKKPLDINHYIQKKAILVTCAVPRQSYFLYSAVISRQWLDYLDDQFTFIENLPLHIQKAITVRLYPHDYGWGQVSRWRDRLPQIHLDGGQSKMSDLILQSRMYISTYNATTFLESFNMNIPTVIYWNTEHWELRDSAIPYFEELERVGIFHPSPASAAKHVAKVWDNVRDWWMSKEVQDVLISFTKQYCHLPENLLNDVEKALKNIISKT